MTFYVLCDTLYWEDFPSSEIRLNMGLHIGTHVSDESTATICKVVLTACTAPKLELLVCTVSYLRTLKSFLAPCKLLIQFHKDLLVV